MVLLAGLHSPDARGTAHGLWLQGLDREAEFRLDSALALFRAATRADGDFLPAHLSYMELMDKQGRNLELRAAYERNGSRSPMDQCVATLAWGRSGHDLPEAARRYDALLRRLGRTPCTEVARVWSHSHSDIRPELLREAIRQYGNSPLLTYAYVTALRVKGEGQSRFITYDTEISNAGSSALAIRYRLNRIGELLAGGDQPAAVAELARVAVAVGRDPRPLLRYKLIEMQRGFLQYEQADYRRRLRPLNHELRSVARRYHAAGFELDPMIEEAVLALDLGDVRAAINDLNEAVALAERTNSPQFRLRAYLLRGRALAAQGRETAAVSDLATAAKAARLLGERYRLADTYHHMAHAYEARANWPGAIAAADSFVRVAGGGRDRALRMISLHDAAAIQWKAGFHVRADALYQRMVTTIEADSGHYEYAGAYFERIGDLGRAAQYYRRASSRDAMGSRKLALAGLSRIYEELDMLDSAIVSARKHDALVRTPEREILLPRLFAKHGRLREANVLADRWADVQRRNGNAATYAAALNQQAELALIGHPARAVALAGRADSAARQVNALFEIVAARRLRGLARAALGDTAGGLGDLSAALSMRAATENVFLPITLKTEIAKLWAASGRIERSLSWYASADDALTAAGNKVDDPLLRAKFRSARHAVFDGAIRAVLDLPVSMRATRLLAWSDRKKGSRAGAYTALPRLPETGRAILDYLTVGDTVLATVITSSGATVRVLPLSARAAAVHAATLIGPLREIHNGRVDIGRATYSLDAAKVLHDGLLGSVADLIGSVTALTIVPDVPLQSIPFDALVARKPPGAHAPGDYGRAVYAADRWMISFSPTVRAVWSPAPGASLRDGGVLLVSHVAPGIEREEAAIQGAWPASRVQALNGRSSTERAVRSASRPSIVHFATHSVSDDADPLRSHLVLEAGDGDDGLLHASEIRRLSWPSSLVFLSACETASGPAYSGTGTLSLARAFLEGGASAVIATQWPVGAISADIAERFYRELASGAPAATALHRARLAVRAKSRTAHPFFWASHVLIAGAAPTRNPRGASTR